MITTIRIKDTTYSTLATDLRNAYMTAVGQSIGDENDYLVNVVVVFHS